MYSWIPGFVRQASDRVPANWLSLWTLLGVLGASGCTGEDAPTAPAAAPQAATEPTPDKSEGARTEAGSASGAEVEEWRALYDAWEDPQPIPDFQLVDQRGSAFRLSRYDDAYLLVGFVFSRCPNPEACPLTMTRMAQVQQAWSERGEQGTQGGRRLELLGVTLDPDYDTPEVLAAYLGQHGGSPENWTMATGPKELVHDALPSLFNVMAFPTSQGLLTHGVKVALLRPGRVLLQEWRRNRFTAEEVVELVLSDGD
ncbi:MAG: SCO family protein [Myxococcota bacterium]|jgi:cytochrome oxidase Cu insertion factor (SCO1/SenC/PrrC family)|nr:SCO family protein [Myxococcota bacterium]